MGALHVKVYTGLLPAYYIIVGFGLVWVWISLGLYYFGFGLLWVWIDLGLD